MHLKSLMRTFWIGFLVFLLQQRRTRDDVESSQKIWTGDDIRWHDTSAAKEKGVAQEDLTSFTRVGQHPGSGQKEWKEHRRERLPSSLKEGFIEFKTCQEDARGQLLGAVGGSCNSLRREYND